jgi:hypothetical protein
MNERQIEMNGQTYVCSLDGDAINVGRLRGDEVEWLESIPVDQVSPGADADAALRGVVTAVVERG